MYSVKAITRNECETYILKIHYAKRWPSITWVFGLFADDELCGVVCYGTPPSSTLRRFIAGDENERYIIELNRLCLKYNKKNEASFLVGRSIKLLPKNKLIVSYADIAQTHTGIVYQATNFLYTGLSTKGSVWKVKGKEHLHNITLLDEFRGVPDRTDKLRAKYGDDLFREPSSRKHRYVYIHGSRTFKKRILSALKYKVRDYPKGDDSISKLENTFSVIDNADNAARGESLSSADFDDILVNAEPAIQPIITCVERVKLPAPSIVADDIYKLKSSDFDDLLVSTAEVSRLNTRCPISSREGRVEFPHADPKISGLVKSKPVKYKMQVEKYEVKRVTREECEPYLLHIHYAKRWPMMSYMFGLFYDGELCGVVTYGQPSSMPLRVNIAGPALEIHIIELTRLCLKHNRKNEASLLVGRSIKMLPKNKIIVSFADTGQDHIGCVYQATNFVYTGLSHAHKQVKMRGRENAHELTILREFKGQPNILQHLKAKYGDRIYHEMTTRKHRYVYFHGDRKFIKIARAALKHKLRAFPKRTDSLEDLQNMYLDDDNIDNAAFGEKLNSKDYADLLV